jgi:prepilin-type N-terminal cleavage/methylation domain-containing protein
MRFSKSKDGFTLIELLVVSGIVGIIALVIFSSLNPRLRFQQARDAVRNTATFQIVEAIRLSRVDYPKLVNYLLTLLSPGDVYMIGSASTGCSNFNANCDTPVTSSTHCANVNALLTFGGYAGGPFVSPNGEGDWSELYTGYTIQTDTNYHVTIRACESESGDEIIQAE